MDEIIKNRFVAKKLVEASNVTTKMTPLVGKQILQMSRKNLRLGKLNVFVDILSMLVTLLPIPKYGKQKQQGIHVT